MRSILESLCFGTVTGISFSLPEDRTNKEISCYDRIKELLKEDNAALLEEYRKLGTALAQALPECRAELEHYNHLVEKPDSRWFTRLCRFKPRERF